MRILLLCFLYCASFISIEATNVFHVTPSAAGAGTSWSDAIHLQGALNLATAGDEIWVAGGVYKPTNTADRSISFVIPDGVKVYGGFNGTETQLSQRNWYLNKTILSGDIGQVSNHSDNSYHVVKIIGTSSNPISESTKFDGFYIQHGNANGVGDFSNGGGIYMEWASPIVMNVWLRNNVSSGVGGAVYGDENSSPKIANCILVENQSNGDGGAVFSNGGLRLINSLFYGNTSSSGAGAVRGSMQTLLLNSIVWGNFSPLGIQLSGVTASNSIVEGGYSGDGNISSDPLFFNAPNKDFRLRGSSPAINSGNNAYVESWHTVDYLGGSRVIESIVDIGPFEGAVITPYLVSPFNNSFLSAGTTDVSLEWNWTTGKPADVVGFELEYIVDGGSKIVVSNIPGNQLMQTIGGLSSTNRVEWRVGSVDVFGNKNWAGWFVFTIQRDRPVYVKPDGTGDGSSWSNASSLVGAINNYIHGDEIWVQSGIYKPTSSTNRNASFELKRGMKLYGGFAGNETSLNQRNWVKNKTILSGNIGDPDSETDNSFRVVTARGTAELPITFSATMDGFIIEGGYGNSETNFNDRGAAMRFEHASPIIVNCWFRDNYSLNFGGAVFTDGNSSPSFYNTIFSNNKSGRFGGAILANRDLLLVNCVLFGNQALTRGGAINGELIPQGGVSVINSIVWNNSAPSFPQMFQVTASHSIVDGGFTGVQIRSDNPQFLDPDESDFRINSLSPAINMGDNARIPAWLDKDFAQNQRIQGSHVDAGIFEGATPVPFPTAPLNNTLFTPEIVNVTLEWEWETEKPSTITHYRLQYQINNQHVETEEGIDSEFFELTGLKPADRVTWRVGAHDQSGDLLWSPWYNFGIRRDEPLFVRPNGTGDGSSWNDAIDLKNALSIASFGDSIWVAKGIYTPTNDGNREISFQLSDGVKVFGGFFGNETEFNQRDVVNNQSILSGLIGDDIKSFHVVKILGTTNHPVSSETILDGVIIQDGNASFSFNNNNLGGGIYLENANPVLANVWFRNNSATGNGGAVYADAMSNPVFANVIFTENSANDHGGAVFSNSSMRFYNCLFYNNHAGRMGGAMSASNSNLNHIHNSIFWGNRADQSFDHFRNIVVRSSIVEDGTGVNSLTDDPLFVDALNFEFNLQNESPAIDSGSTQHMPDWISFDFRGEPRVQGDMIDIGPFEFPVDDNGGDNGGDNGTNIENSQLLNASLQIIPNPVSRNQNINIVAERITDGTLYVSIYDLAGRLLHSEKLMVTNRVASLSSMDFNPGNYIVIIQTNDTVRPVTRQLIIR
ncbi:choice-of-anchor Q domain-containing protein [Natronoflexus pectinivorans]|uniref:Putative secreted protein (Por secretion system target) n=1 Tax=Natronoflexus pectinivorans TaxID=682526 RepID=A0A4R2GHF1_9BACT|nr:choice-of-anchor Q domain-containing protein [Natronoflexus pectinivorans]TCO07767.1 putative secreted protein (Por secretion system target) [Natronoflexus pectinivorans]